MGRPLIAVGLVVLGATQLLTAQPVPDSGYRRPPIISRHDALIWGSGVAVAFLADAVVRRVAQENRTVATNDVAGVGNSFGHVATVAPALVGTWLFGTITGKKRVAEAAMWAAVSGAAAGGVTAIVKIAVGRQRPPLGDALAFRPFSRHAAFPSGHTSFAFAIASSLAHSTPDGWSDIGFFAAASLTGLSRINHDRHWASDVVAGAAVGYLIGRQLTLRPGRLAPVLSPAGVGINLTF